MTFLIEMDDGSARVLTPAAQVWDELRSVEEALSRGGWFVYDGLQNAAERLSGASARVVPA